MNEHEQAQGQHRAVGTLLLVFGTFVVLLALYLGPYAQLDNAFLTPTDMGVIGAVMLGLGTWMRGWSPPVD